MPSPLVPHPFLADVLPDPTPAASTGPSVLLVVGLVLIAVAVIVALVLVLGRRGGRVDDPPAPGAPPDPDGPPVPPAQ